MKLLCLFLFLFNVTNLFARTQCLVLPNTDILPGMIASADTMACFATKDQYKCDELEKELEGEEKNRIIKCDARSLNEQKMGNTSFSNCIWNGIVISGESLLDLASLPGKIAGGIANSFKETQACNKSVDKKREILNAFNLTIEDERFKLSENFVGKWLEDAPCSEIEKLLSSRYQNYQNTMYRERINMINAGKGANLKPLKKDTSGGSNLISMLKAALNEAGTRYQCYSPKVKAEMICAGVTTLITDVALGGGVLLAAKRINAVVKSKKALDRAQSAMARGEKVDLKDSALLMDKDRIKAAETLLKRSIDQDEADAILTAHNVGKKRGFGNYTQQDIADKARELKKVKTIDMKERRDLMENGITGTMSVSQKLVYGEAHRLKAQRFLSDAYSVGDRAKIKTGTDEVRKYYYELSQLGTKDIKKIYTPDRHGLLEIKTANEFGLNAKESAQLVDKMIAANDLNPLQAHRSVIGYLSESIKEMTERHAAKYGNTLPFNIYRAKELRAELLERYYTLKYPDKYNELDWDKMNPREQNILSDIRVELLEARKQAEKNKFPVLR